MGFLHEHKLALENDFQFVLKGGKTQVNYPLRFLYTIKKCETSSFQVAISVPKKKFHNAVDRNLLKRRIREGVRHVYSQYKFENVEIKILVVYCDSTIFKQQELEIRINQALQKILDDAENI